MFVALDLPDEVRAGLEGWGARELTDPALRQVQPEALHITLCFLGWQRERDAEAIAAEIATASRDPVELRFEPEPVAVPRERRPARLFAVEAPSPAADSLAAEVCGLLERARFYEPEKRRLLVARDGGEGAGGEGSEGGRGQARQAPEGPSAACRAGARTAAG